MLFWTSLDENLIYSYKDSDRGVSPRFFMVFVTSAHGIIIIGRLCADRECTTFRICRRYFALSPILSIDFLSKVEKCQLVCTLLMRLLQLMLGWHCRSGSVLGNMHWNWKRPFQCTVFSRLGRPHEFP